MLTLLSEKFVNYRAKALKIRLSDLGYDVKIGRVFGIKIGLNHSTLITACFGNGDYFAYFES